MLKIKLNTKYLLNAHYQLMSRKKSAPNFLMTAYKSFIRVFSAKHDIDNVWNALNERYVRRKEYAY
jgi:hypothetical protein